MAVFTPISRRAAVAVVALLVAGATPCLAGTTLVDPYGRPVATADGQGGSVDYRRPGRVRRVARGQLESVSPDGRAVIVAEEAAPSGQPWARCDELFFSQLFVASLDGGKRRPLRLDGRDVYGTLVSGPGQTMAVTEECDGDLTALTVAAQDGRGDLHGGRRVPVDDGLPAPWWMSDFSTAGDALLAVYVEDPKDPNSRRVAIAIDVESGKVTELARGAIDMVAGQPGGRLVVSEGGRVTVRDGNGRPIASAKGQAFSLAPDRERVVVVDQGRLSLLTPEGTTTLVEESRGWDIIQVAWSPDGSAVAYTAVLADAHGLDDDSKLNVVTLRPEPRVVPVASGSRQGFWHPIFSPDGRTLAYQVFDPQQGDDTFTVWVSSFPER